MESGQSGDQRPIHWHLALLQLKAIRCFARGGTVMLWTILVILLVLWLLGMVTSYTMGGLIHLLLVVAVIILIIRLVSGRRVL
jgi:hypothetical protein